MATPQTQLRSLYRRILRELPARSASTTLLSHPSALQTHVRSALLSPSAAPTTPLSPLSKHALADASSASSHFSDTLNLHPETLEAQLARGEEFVRYVQSQRRYLSLLERYNPGMNMSEEERTRLTARRVGMDLPVDRDGNVL